MPLSFPQRLLIGAGGLALVTAPILWLRLGDDGRIAPTRAWEETVAAMDANPDVLLAFLAERTFARDGTWDYRWMSVPFQQVWATLRFERGMTRPGPDSPTFDEAAAAYRAMGLDEVADLVNRLGQAQDGAEAQASARAIVAARPRILTARRTYMETHRAELENP